MTSLPSFQLFSVQETAPDICWGKVEVKTIQPCSCNKCKKNDKPRQRAILLHCAGENVNKTLETLNSTQETTTTLLKQNLQNILHQTKL